MRIKIASRELTGNLTEALNSSLAVRNPESEEK